MVSRKTRRLQKQKRNQRGGALTFSFEKSKNHTELYYFALNTLPKSLRNRIKASSSVSETQENFEIPRKFSKAKFLTSGDTAITLPLMKDVNTRLEELGEIPLDVSKTYVLSFLENLAEKSILENTKTGTFVREANAKAIFEPNVYEGNQKQINFTKPMPLKKEPLFFLQKGMGAKLLRHAMDDLKRNQGAEAILLICESPDLQKYYEGFGFVVVPNVPYLPRFGYKDISYGNEASHSGPVMVKRL